MPSSPEEAAAALRAISTIEVRAAGFQDYRAESRQLMLWGVANMLGCALSAVLPQSLLLIWLTVIIAGMLVGVRLARDTHGATPGIAWRYLTIIGSMVGFVVLLNVVMWPLSPRQGSMIVPLFVAALYAIRGAQSRPRYLLIGLALAVTCLCCFLFAAEYYWWWLALAWGGTLILSGCWLRRT